MKVIRVDAVMIERIREGVTEAEGDLWRLPLREDARADRWAKEKIRLGLDLSAIIPDPVKAEEAAKRVVGFAFRLFDVPCPGDASDQEAEELLGKIEVAVGVVMGEAAMYKYNGGQGEHEDMVTIAKIVEDTGVKERRVRERIRVAQERGIIREGIEWERQGGVILIDRKIGAELATEKKKRGPQRVAQYV